MPKKTKHTPKRRHTPKKSTPKRKANHVSKTKRKKSNTKSVERSKQRTSDRVSKTRRTGNAKKSKLVTKAKSKVSGKPVRQGKAKHSKQRSKPTVEITRPKSRKDQKIHFTFKHVRSVDKKLNLIDSATDKVLSQQFKRKGGEPPLGLVVTVTDRNGRSASDLAPSDMVINRQNTKDFIKRWMNALKSNNIKFRERNHNLPKGSKPVKDNNYDDFNPDNATTITVKFIYAKVETDEQ